jgi:MFS family permease
MTIANDRNFRLFWAGQTASNLGDALGFVAMPLLVFEATKSVVAMGTVTAITGVGQLTGATFSGVVVDRVNRRRLMLACDLVRMVLYAALPLTTMLHAPSMAIICFVTAIAAVTSNLFMVAHMASIPNLVDASEVASANGRLQATQALTFVVGSAFAGIVCNRFGPAWALGIDAISFALSALSLSRIAFRSEGATRASGGLSDLWSGLFFLAQSRVLRSLALFQTGVALLGSIGVGAAVIDLIVYRLKTDFDASGALVGGVLALASIGAVLGAISAARARRAFSFGAIAVMGTAIQACGMLAAGLGHGAISITLGGVLWSGGLTFRSVGATSLRQTSTPDALLGRVVAAGWVLIFSAGALGAVLVTRVAAAIGAAHTSTCIGIALAILCGFAARSPLVTASEPKPRTP